MESAGLGDPSHLRPPRPGKPWASPAATTACQWVPGRSAPTPYAGAGSVAAASGATSSPSPAAGSAAGGGAGGLGAALASQAS